MTQLRQAVLLAVTLVLALALSACESKIELELHQNDTYDFSMAFSFNRDDYPNYTCEDFKRALGDSASSKQLKILDRSTEKQIKCSLTFTQPQPISLTKSPFVVITRKADIFRLKFAPFEDFAVFVEDDMKLELTVVFPGEVLGASGGKTAKIQGNKVTWTSPDIIHQGFTAEGKAYAGTPIWLRFVYLLLLTMIVLAVLLYILRNTATVRQIRAWLAQYDRAMGSPFKRSAHLVKDAYYAFTDWLYLKFHKQK